MSEPLDDARVALLLRRANAVAQRAMDMGRHPPGAYLAQCTLVTTFEPCAMCAGTIYWAGIGRVLYGAEETALLALTRDHPENPTLALPCRTVFASGQRHTEALGPVPALAEEITALHRDFWR